MNFSHQLRPYQPGPLAPQLWDRPNADIHQGAFSVVIMNPNVEVTSNVGFPLKTPQVVKVTHCPPSIVMLSQLAKEPGPPGLPRVTKCLGPTAVNQDNQVYWGFAIERLEGPKTQQQKNLLDGFLGEVDLLDKLLTTQGLRNWVHSAQLVDHLAAANLCGLRDAFAYLSKVIHQERAVLDLFREGNVLFDQAGNLCLSDPIALTWESEEQLAPLKWAIDPQGNTVLPPTAFKLSLT